jgi:predicted phage-related endonuclease
MTEKEISTDVVEFDAGGALVPQVIADREHDRAKLLGGSDIAAVLGLSKRRSPLQVYRAKIGDAPELADADRLFFERRRRCEPVIFAMMREELDADIAATNVRYRDPEHSFMAAEIDAEVRDAGGTINVEAKTVDPFVFGGRTSEWGAPGTDEIPTDYECQVQWGLGVTGRHRAVVAAMISFDRMVFYSVTRNDRAISIMRERAQAFWHEHVLARVPPEPRTAEDIAYLYPTHEDGASLVVGGDHADKAMRLRTVNDKIAAYESERDELLYYFKRQMGRAESLILENGERVATWRTQEYSQLDIAALKMKDPKAYRAFLLKGQRRVFRILKGK